MSEKRPFIPTDKPKSWVLFILACLTGIAIGLIAFIAAYNELNVVAKIVSPFFFICWLIAAVNWFIFMFGLLTGRYKKIEHRSWNEQVW